MNPQKDIVLGTPVTLETLVDVARHGAKVSFSQEYRERVDRSRALVEQWVQEGRAIYGVTTGFGALCTKSIDPQDTAQLQRNILLSHSASVGAPLPVEQVRGIMFAVLQNLGQGYSGVRMCILERYAEFLNRGLTPWAPGEGSVGYLAPEAHIALVLIGEGKAYVNGALLSAAQALEAVGLAPMELASKEGLALVSGTTSATAMGGLALWDLLQAAEAADAIGAMTLEALQGVIYAFDQRVMEVRPHPEQAQTAARVRSILADSKVIDDAKDTHIQDALSLRCIPQLHGAAKKTLLDARRTIEIELNSCCDNPLIWTDGVEAQVISACNPDSSYVGIELDSASIAATMLAKMSERRNNRLIDQSLSGYPSFLIQNPGLNSGLMIPQYTQAGLLGEMRILSTPSVIDNTPTCGNQEDYVAMGYNASKKAGQVAQKLEYILAIELLSVYQAQQFLNRAQDVSSFTKAVVKRLGAVIPNETQDFYLHPCIEALRELIHDGTLQALLSSTEKE